MAIALLAATGQIPTAGLENKMIVGELSLDGSIKAVSGLVAFQICALQQGLDLLCAPTLETLVSSDGVSLVYTAENLHSFRYGNFSKATHTHHDASSAKIDFADVGGHAMAKRALQIAAAGNHGLLMIGPPGSGKTMLAKRLPTILPSLSEKEKGESAQIASIVGEPIDGILQGIRPFRAPHHSATMAGLIGGGNPVRPGEVSLAHNGVLMLDELSEFSQSVLQGLRQPIEDGKVSITRADGNIVMPARFMLIAASNPCPCGYYGDAQVACTCPVHKVNAYQNKIGGPLIDRFDMCIDVWRSDFEEVVAGDKTITSSYLKEGVLAAREFAYRRFMKSEDASTSQDVSVRALMASCSMDGATEKYFEEMAKLYVLSGRGIMRTLRVARTIADIEQSTCVLQEHIAEALTLRVRSQEQIQQAKVG